MTLQPGIWIRTTRPAPRCEAGLQAMPPGSSSACRVTGGAGGLVPPLAKHLALAHVMLFYFIFHVFVAPGCVHAGAREAGSMAAWVQRAAGAAAAEGRGGLVARAPRYRLPRRCGHQPRRLAWLPPPAVLCTVEVQPAVHADLPGNQSNVHHCEVRRWRGCEGGRGDGRRGLSEPPTARSQRQHAHHPLALRHPLVCVNRER